MSYVSLSALRSALATRPRLAVLRARSLRRGADSEPDHIAFDFDEAVDCRIYQPKFITASSSRLAMVRVGFLISLHEALRLRWVRFRLVFNSKDTEIASLFPDCVTHPERFEGRIAIGDGGQLSWDPVDAGSEGPSGAIFSPRVVGRQINHRSVFWDFLPWNLREPAGTDNLIIAARIGSTVNLHLEARVLLGVLHKAEGTVYLELREESLDVAPCQVES
jgi:hypothetical protein